MKVAFYKSNKHIFNFLVSWWTRGKYSHVEAVFEGPNSKGEYLCASSSNRDGGVRFKWMQLPLDTWDVLDVPWAPNDTKQWFEDHLGEKYDVLGLFGFVIRRGIQDKKKWFCSEALAESFKLVESWRFDPNTLYAHLMSRLINK